MVFSWRVCQLDATPDSSLVDDSNSLKICENIVKFKGIGDYPSSFSNFPIESAPKVSV
tara:strand:- start:75 stop:248 length:174 start_codon:yes stop_codon:yes gene_type:complete